MIYTIAKWWVVGFIGAAAALLIVAITGAAVTGQSAPDGMFPRLLMFALAAIAWSIPGGFVIVYGIIKRP